jgi:hypothetical protein
MATVSHTDETLGVAPGFLHSTRVFSIRVYLIMGFGPRGRERCQGRGYAGSLERDFEVQVRPEPDPDSPCVDPTRPATSGSAWPADPRLGLENGIGRSIDRRLKGLEQIK